VPAYIIQCKRYHSLSPAKLYPILLAQTTCSYAKLVAHTLCHLLEKNSTNTLTQSILIQFWWNWPNCGRVINNYDCDLFLVLEHGLQLVQEDVGVLGLEDQGRTKPDGTLAAAAAVHTLQTEFAKKTITSESSMMSWNL